MGMRSRWRSLKERLGAALLRDIALVCLAVGLVGASYGAITVSEGFPVWTPTLMSCWSSRVRASSCSPGSSAAGGSPVAAVLAGLLVNARHLAFGFALADTVRQHRLLGSYFMVDEAVAFALAQEEPERRRLAYFTCALGL